MPEAILNNQCKICNLIKVDDQLWVKVHTKVIEEGLAHSVVCKWLNGMVDVWNASASEPLFKFNSVNFTNHFKNHITSLDSMKLELKNWTLVKPKKDTVAFDERQKMLASSVATSSTDGYTKLSNMIDMMEENLEYYSDGIRDKREKQRRQELEGKKVYVVEVSPKEIEHYSKFVSDLISAKQNLLKLKNTEQTTMMAVDSAVEFMVQGMTSGVKLLAEDVRITLESELEGQTSLPDQIAKSIRATFGNNVRVIVKETEDMIKRNYGNR